MPRWCVHAQDRHPRSLCRRRRYQSCPQIHLNRPQKKLSYLRQVSVGLLFCWSFAWALPFLFVSEEAIRIHFRSWTTRGAHRYFQVHLLMLRPHSSPSCFYTHCTFVNHLNIQYSCPNVVHNVDFFHDQH